MYCTEIDLSWADRWLVRSRTANLCFISRLCIFGPRSNARPFDILDPQSQPHLGALRSSCVPNLVALASILFQSSCQKSHIHSFNTVVCMYTYIHTYRQRDRHRKQGAYYCNLALLHGCGLNMGLMSPSTDYRTGQSPHLSYRKETTSSVRTSCKSQPITRPLMHSSSSHQSSSGRLATPGRSTKADMALYNRDWPSAL